MIPADVISRLQLPADAAVTKVPTVQQVADALADLSPGQRVLAEIQTLLPNGAYRALVNQRDVTLALPFSAKAGDSLELEVVDSDGKLTLAVVSRKESAAAQATSAEQPSVDTTLSRTGNFIASLLSDQADGKPAKPALLNAQQPVAPAPPQRGADLVPLLRQAIGESGMFYESHQSQWVASRLSTDALLAQPQGRLSDVLQHQESSPSRASAADIALMSSPANSDKTAGTTMPADASTSASRAAAQTLPGSAIVAPELVPLVQQQLEALATQTYVWQGQAWPGQPMQWEIVEEDASRREAGDVEASQWQTRLTLTMPSLGEVKATLKLVGNELAVSLSTLDAEAANRLQSAGESLHQQFEANGLTVNAIAVTQHEQPG